MCSSAYAFTQRLTATFLSLATCKVEGVSEEEMTRQLDKIEKAVQEKNKVIEETTKKLAELKKLEIESSRLELKIKKKIKDCGKVVF